MKSTFIGMVTLLVTMTIQAQNKNVKDETITTVTTVTTSDGEKKYVKKENTVEVQNIELKEEKPNTLNIETKDSPVEVTKTTKIINPDGSTRTVDIDRSAYYELGGKKYKVALDANGYRMIADDNKTSSLLRKTSTNSYIYSSGTKTSIAYFDVNGNLVLESYNPKTDQVTFETYTVVKQ